MDSLFIIDKGGKRRKAIESICQTCGKSFLAEERFIESGKRKYCSRECACESRKNRIKFICPICGKETDRVESRKSKSGLFFCSRECKEIAQSIQSGSEYDLIRPNHYNTGIDSYREKALNNYELKCEICGYKECLPILEVHHIDGNRKNNDLENLIVLCPNHHAMITRKIARIEDRKLIMGL